MKKVLSIGGLLTSVFLSAVSLAQTPSGCPADAHIAVQVLGSGGPIADDQRASAGYVVWVDGESRAIVDLGGGSLLRLAQAGVSFNELDFVGLSHLHADHSADFVALLKSGNFSGRRRELTISGPDAGGPFPGLVEFVHALLDKNRGAYRYLSGYLDGTDRLPKLVLEEVPESAAAATTVFENGDMRILATHVPHGIVPALGFRIDVDGRSIVLASDQNGSDEDFAVFASRADLLVMHLPIGEGTTDTALQLHALPSRVGEIASAAHSERLMLSHFMARSLRDLDRNVAIVKDHFDGPVIVAEDLACLVID